MKKYCVLFFSMVVYCVSLDLYAEGEAYGCIQYKRVDFTWGDPYKVPVFITNGEKMIEATNDFDKYQAYYNYAIVEWPNGGYSALQIPSYQTELSYGYTQTKGQNGRTYRIKQAPAYDACSPY